MNKSGRLAASGIAMLSLKETVEKDPEELQSQIDSYSCNHYMQIIIQIIRIVILDAMTQPFKLNKIRNIIKSYNYFKHVNWRKVTFFKRER